VGLGLSEPVYWPPLYGSIGEAWSIRQFWGVFWHQKLRNVIESPSDFISTSVLGLRKGTLLSRYTRLTLAFLISGVLHAALDHGQGVPFTESGALKFFTMQALGIMVEDAMQEVYQRCGGPSNVWSRGVGYTWVAFWFIWTTPTWTWRPARLLLA